MLHRSSSGGKKLGGTQGKTRSNTCVTSVGRMQGSTAGREVDTDPVEKYTRYPHIINYSCILLRLFLLVGDHPCRLTTFLDRSVFGVLIALSCWLATFLAG